MFVGLALLVPAFRFLTLVESFLLGTVTGFVYYGFLAQWTTVYLGLLPWFGLVSVQALIFAFGSILLTLAWRFTNNGPQSVFGETTSTGLLVRTAVTSLVVASAWSVREALAAIWPFGGFAWGRVIHSQAESPVGRLVTITGTTVAGTLVVALVVWIVVVWSHGIDQQNRIRLTTLALVSVVTLIPLSALFTNPHGETLRVLAVQGNSNSALFAQIQPGDSIRAHYSAMRDSWNDDVDVVLWPENAADINPLTNISAAEVAEEISAHFDAPFLFGTITWKGDESFNSVVKWEYAQGATDQYDKIHPVPFAEYLPARDFFYPLAPDMFDMVPRDYSFGTRDTVMDIDGVTVGVNICYDIVDDQIFRSMIADGAQVIFSPTNNADFGHSNQNIQQLGIARIRAMETGRSVVNDSTVGVSAIIAPNGSDIVRLEPYAPGVMIADVPLSTITTPAMLAGRYFDAVICAVGVLPILVRRRRV